MNYTDIKIQQLLYAMESNRILQLYTQIQVYSNYAKNSTVKGNYKADTIIKTGINDNYKMNNIYDLAGNAIKWTMELYNIS